ncbi:hypothetical protein [Photorhabdus sp. SF281]|uniref:hypothetical protein n=1 Tax=Photorhabdus sp. SF281 TaxID=3459527 RepID=UPI004044D302
MLKIRKKPSNITLQLTQTWEKSDKLWGAKDLQSRFIYANPAFYQLLNPRQPHECSNKKQSEWYSSYSDNGTC